MQMINETTQFGDQECHETVGFAKHQQYQKELLWYLNGTLYTKLQDQLIPKLKKQLNKFVEERER